MRRNTGAHTDSVPAFVRAAISGVTGRSARIALFYAVRNLAYATDAASDARTLARLRRGNCLAKADLLAQAFTQLGYRTRAVRWLYRLPDAPVEVALLPTRDDIHTAVDVFLDGQWRLVDATHDPPLETIGFVVNNWDGTHATLPGHAGRGPVWHVGEDDNAIAAASEAIAARYTPEMTVRAGEYRVAFNRWLDAARANDQPHGSDINR